MRVEMHYCGYDGEQAWTVHVYDGDDVAEAIYEGPPPTRDQIICDWKARRGSWRALIAVRVRG